ncbi:hypothetical protein D9758_017124 [Tetrapyrgos nigripes]|uniref:Uncharacterized protein n=1 Tax=Tetrapyrgos nigripes TaxID=182062 RepID=A0A8H5FMY6_9AGAR|nr:hypothetical protein D9758_017124 [Tetrapyrgos nigripes]
MSSVNRPNARRPRVPATAAPAAVALNDNLPKPKKGSAPPVQAGNGMALQGTRDPHPAKPDMPAPRRSSDEVNTEKLAKATDKAARVTARNNAITRTAELEDRMLQEDKDAEKNANHPPKSTMKKKANPKPATDTAVEEPETNVKTNSETSSERTVEDKMKRKRSSTAKNQDSRTPEAPTTLEDVASEHPQGDVDISSDDDNVEAGLDNSDNDKPAPKKARVSGSRKKGELRAQVSAKRTESPRPNVTSEPPAKKSKKGPQGLRPQWSTQKQVSTISSSTSGPDTKNPVSNVEASETKDGEDADYEYGGFGDEKGDDEENPEVTGATGRSIKIKAKSLAAVVQHGDPAGKKF